MRETPLCDCWHYPCVESPIGSLSGWLSSHREAGGQLHSLVTVSGDSIFTAQVYCGLGNPLSSALCVFLAILVLHAAPAGEVSGSHGLCMWLLRLPCWAHSGQGSGSDASPRDWLCWLRNCEQSPFLGCCSARASWARAGSIRITWRRMEEFSLFGC